MKILITGSSGTVGTELCETLMREHEVAGVDMRPNHWSQEVDRLTTKADLRDPEAFSKFATDFDAIVHLAANARVFDLVKDPAKARDNFEMLFQTLEFARKNGIPRFLFASSREVYGNSQQIVHTEDEAYVKYCESPYTASKVGGEALVHSYQQCYGMGMVIFRLSNVYGKYDSSDRLIPLYYSKAKAGEPLYVYGKEKLLDFTYITDAVRGISACIDRFDTVTNMTFNIASGAGTSILSVAQLVKEMMSSKSDIVVEDSRTGEVVKFVADIDQAKRILGFEPRVTIVEGVKRSVAWYHENLK